MEGYEHLTLKEYRYFTLQVYGESQYFLGRGLAWLTREGTKQRFSELLPEEVEELHQVILPEYEAALQALWQPDHMNYAWLGNGFAMHGGHGHMHLIPRYETPRVFNGRTFTDELWGNNYTPTPKLDLPRDELLAIRDALRAQFT
jgi:diadenosine tetraphosphate (Ap4A) HIT family hydrolase